MLSIDNIGFYGDIVKGGSSVESVAADGRLWVSAGQVVCSAEQVDRIRDLYATYPQALRVVDPVMVSTSGSALMQADALAAFRSELVPLATILTPNMHEAATLSGLAITDEASCHAAGLVIARDSHCSVLIKGGHIEGGHKVDRLYDADGRLVETFAAESVYTVNTHGTGCTLSSAIACFMGRGYAVADAVRLAKDYVTAALAAGAGVGIGQGHGPVNHFFNPLKMLTV